jgi:pimeloyl-ACP methyl ester carboxylesterase
MNRCMACVLVTAFSCSGAMAQITGTPPAKPSETPVPAPATGLVARQPGEQPFVEVSFTPFEKVQTRGTGPIHIILIPPFNADWRLWNSFMERNAGRYTMHAVSLPGFGGTTPPPQPAGGYYTDGPWTANAERAVLKLIEEKSLDKPFIMGQAYGGHVALRVALRHPEKVSGVISIDGSATVELPNQSDPKLPAADREKFVVGSVRAGEHVSEERFMTRQRDAAKAIASDPAKGELIASMLDGASQSTVLRYFGEYYAANLWPELPTLKARTAVLVPIPDEGPGRGMDRQIKKRWERWFLAANKSLDLVWFDNTKPMVALEAPNELDRAVHDFVHGKFVRGKSRFSKPMDKFLPAEEGGPDDGVVRSDSGADSGADSGKGGAGGGDPAPAPSSGSPTPDQPAAPESPTPAGDPK